MALSIAWLIDGPSRAPELVGPGTQEEEVLPQSAVRRAEAAGSPGRRTPASPVAADPEPQLTPPIRASAPPLRTNAFTWSKPSLAIWAISTATPALVSWVAEEAD